MFGTIRIGKHQRGLWFRNGDFRGLLQPGVHRFWAGLWNGGRDHVDVVDTRSVRFEHPMLDVLVRTQCIRDALQVIEVAPGERALIWINNQLRQIHGPGVFAYWIEPHRFDFEVHRIGRSRLDHPRIGEILAHAEAERWLQSVEVAPGEQVMPCRYGVPMAPLAPGLHVFWKGDGVSLGDRLASPPQATMASASAG